MESKQVRILMVLTSHDQLGDTGDKTGFWVEEFAAPYYVFKDAGAEVVVSTPSGGKAPIDPKSESADAQTEATERYYKDREAQTLIENTIKLSTVSAENYDAVFYPGGHGPLWDLTDNQESIRLISDFVTSNKPVSAVCHATAAFLNVKNEDGSYLVNGIAVTGFSNSEEAAVGLTDVVPFLLEDELKKRGANYQRGDDWSVFALQEGLVISGQNPASSALVAEKLLDQIAKR